MNDHRLVTHAFALACMAALVSWPAFASEIDTAAEEHAIRQADATWSKDLQSKDLDAVMENYAQDAAFLVPNQPIIVGKKAIREWFQARIDTPGYTASFEPTQIVVSSAGDMAYELGTFAASSRTTDGATVRTVGKHLVTWTKRNGRWLVAAEAISSDTPRPTPSK